MELLTRNNFESWMQKLMERLDRQDELLLAMKAEERQPALTESIRLFDNQDLCMLLQISKRTLQRYRSVGALPTRHWARRPITARRTCWSSFPTMSRSSKRKI